MSEVDPARPVRPTTVDLAPHLDAVLGHDLTEPPFDARRRWHVVRAAHLGVGTQTPDAVPPRRPIESRNRRTDGPDSRRMAHNESTRRSARSGRNVANRCIATVSGRTIGTPSRTVVHSTGSDRTRWTTASPDGRRVGVDLTSWIGVVEQPRSPHHAAADSCDSTAPGPASISATIRRRAVVSGAPVLTRTSSVTGCQPGPTPAQSMADRVRPSVRSWWRPTTPCCVSASRTARWSCSCDTTAAWARDRRQPTGIAPRAPRPGPILRTVVRNARWSVRSASQNGVGGAGEAGCYSEPGGRRRL